MPSSPSSALSSISRLEKEAILSAYQLRLERNRRKTGKAEPNKFARYLTDPVGFFTGPLNYFIWSKQREIVTALTRYDRVAVKSCHESGKSFTAGGVVGWWIAAHPPKEAFVVTTAPTFNQVRAILWREVNRVWARGKLPGYTNQTEWVIDRELVAFGRKPEDGAPDAFQGHHARHMLVVLDEACGVPKSLWDAAESLVANEGGKILAIGNPDDPQTEFGRVCKPGSGYHVITISAFDTPNLTGETVPADLQARLIGRSWVEERRKRWGESSPIYKSKVLGEFPETSQDSLIPPRLVQAAVDRNLEPDPADEVHLGVDVARFGRNETVIYRRQGPVARLYGAYHQRDTMTVAGLVMQAVFETGARVVKIDDIGVGGGVVDRLREIQKERTPSGNPLANVQIVGVNVGVAASETPRKPGEKAPKERFVNLKAQLCFDLRDRFVEGEIDLDDDLDAQAQLCEIRYEVTSRGLLKIESKDEIEERLAKIGGASGESGSPDRFDALVLAFAETDATKPKVLFTQAHLAKLAAAGQPAYR